MLKRKSFLLYLCVMALSQLNFVDEAFSQVKQFKGRVAISSDGNAHDRDDIGATPMGLAILWKAGMKGKLVHYGYNNHIWFNGPNGQKADMTESALGAAERFDYDKSVFFSVTDDKTLAYGKLAKEIDNSGPDDPLYILAGGPYEHICQAIKQSMQSRRRYVTVINHGDSNPIHQHNGSCVAAQVRKLGVKYVDIVNQNGWVGKSKTNKEGFNNPWSEWTWLQNSSNTKLRWVYSRMKEAIPSHADVSDAGMVWYLVTGGPSNGGQQRANPMDLKSFFGK